jgi:NhaP-type Na+/H+ or K+/H+ antiporter
MVRSTSAQLGLLAFAVAIVAGLNVGNSATLVLSRALLALVAGALLGQIAGWAARAVLRDFLQRKKLGIDQEHFAAVQKMVAELPPAETVPTAEPQVAQEVGS